MADQEVRLRLDPTTFDGQRFREALGHYPTGVVVITAIADDDTPIGMVIGSFTSVSLDPPLVAFLPMTSSWAFARMRTADSFCVNVLGADQEDLCRVFASRETDKFSGLNWQRSPGGAPILPNVVAWIECRYADIIEAGDHYIVLGAVTAMDIPRPALPLLFFQGGYGRFSPASLMALGEPATFEAVRLAERIRADVEALADQIGVNCSVVADIGDEMVFVSTSDGGEGLGFITVGARLPLMAPVGAAFFVDRPAAEVDAWIARSALPAEGLRESALADIAVVTDRGFSVALREGRTDTGAFERAVAAYTGGRALPAEERRLRQELAGMLHTTEPDIDPHRHYEIHSVTVPIPHRTGEPRVALRLAHLPPQVTGTQVLDWVRRVQRIAATARP